MGSFSLLGISNQDNLNFLLRVDHAYLNESMWLFFVALTFATVSIFVQEVWVSMAFAAAVCLLLLIETLRGGGDTSNHPFILLIPAWGVAQLAFGLTIYPQATLQATLHWMSLAAVFLLARRHGLLKDERRTFLDCFVGFAAFQAVLCLAQLHTSQGKILWWIPSGYDDYVYGTFQSYNNFAQFAELALPVALVRAFQNRKQAIWYIFAAGLLFSAVIASTSRAGAVLVTAELVVVPTVLLLTMSRSTRRQGLRQVGFILAGIPLLAVLLTLAAGWDRLLQRFQAGDSLAGRREFLSSTIDMAREHPFVGHGLGTFSYAYPRFASIDLAAIVNHAHNDWAEFAAEGGFLFAIAVLVVLIGASSRFLRHPWAIGTVFMALHATVDFPFARLGVIGWFFALLGVLYATRDEEREAVEANAVSRWGTFAVAAAGFVGAVWLAVSNVFYLIDTPDSLAKALRMVPGDASYWLRHAQLTGNPASLENALRLNPYDSHILVEAGLRAEIAGHPARAQDLFLSAAARDKTWIPRWTLANFYYRQNNPDEFWKWAKAAASAGSQRDFGPLFRLALEIEPDRDAAAGKLLPDRPEVLRAWISYILVNSPDKAVAGLESAARLLLKSGVQSPDRNYVVSAVERFLAAKSAAPAGDLWKGMLQRGWLPAGIGQSFGTLPLGEGFDWRMSPAEGVNVSPHTGTMTVSFSGKQPEFWPALQRLAQVEPHMRYRLRIEYETDGMPPSGGSGLRLRVLDEMSGVELARTTPLTAALKKEEMLEFEATAPLVRIQLYCEREQGYGRITGTIHLSAAELSRII